MTAPEARWHGPDDYTGTREQAVAVAMERQLMSCESGLRPGVHWADLTQHERDVSITDAANWLTAVRRTGLLITPDEED